MGFFCLGTMVTKRQEHDPFSKQRTPSGAMLKMSGCLRVLGVAQGTVTGPSPVLLVYDVTSDPP